METVKHQQWRITVHAKAKNLNLKIRASRILPSSRFYETQRFALVLKIRRFLLKVDSETGEAKGRRRGSFKSKLLRVWEKLRLKKNVFSSGVKNSSLRQTDINSQGKRPRIIVNEGGLISPVLVGNLALLSRSVSDKDKGGIIIHTSTLLLYLALLIKNFISRKNNSSVILVALMVSLIGFSLNYLNYLGHISNSVWMTWSHVTSFGCSYLLTQVIFSWFSQYMGRNKLNGVLLTVLNPIVSIMLWKAMGHYLVAKVILICLTFLQTHVLSNHQDPKTLAVFVVSAPLLVKEMTSLLTNYGSNLTIYHNIYNSS